LKKPRSYLVTLLLAAGTLYFAQDLSRSGRGTIDWIVIGLLGLAVMWNLARLGQRLHRAGGGRDVWHLVRTVTFWIVGVWNSGLIRPAGAGAWSQVAGWAFLVAAALDSVALYRKERAALGGLAGNSASDGAPGASPEA